MLVCRRVFWWLGDDFWSDFSKMERLREFKGMDRYGKVLRIYHSSKRT
jgi:hypothetical protein